MTIEHFNTFTNICAEHSWKITNVFRNNVDFGEFEEIRKEDYPYDPQDFADYMNTVFEVLHNEDAKIIDDNLGIPIYPLHGDAEMTHQRSEFIQFFQEIYDTICSQGYSPMSISEDDSESESDTESDTEIDNNTNTAVDSDDESDDESEDDNTETNHPLHIINTESENGRVIWFTCFNNERYEVTDNNVIMIYGDMVGNFDQEHNHAYFEENYFNEPHIDVRDFDEIRRLLIFDDEIELPEQE